jgi:hypothetical protein
MREIYDGVQAYRRGGLYVDADEHRKLELENAALRHDLAKSMANHVADINGPQSDRSAE